MPTLPGDVEIWTQFRNFAEKTSLEGKLLLVKIDRIERYTHTQQATPLGGWLPLHSQVVEIQVPVIYNYFVSVKQPWHFRWKRSQFEGGAPTLVVEPPLLTTEMPATRIAELKWLRKSSPAHMNEALLTMGAELMNRAVAGKDQVRDKADIAIEELVQNWWREGRPTTAWPEHVEVRLKGRERTP